MVPPRSNHQLTPDRTTSLRSLRATPTTPADSAADVGSVADLIDASGHAPTLAVIGFDTALVLQMIAGRVSCAVWDHGTLQGYLAVALAALADTSFLVPDLIFNAAQLLIEPSILTTEGMTRLLARAGG